VLISGCDSLPVSNYNVYLAKTFKPMSENQQADLLARTGSHAGTAVEDYKRGSPSIEKVIAADLIAASGREQQPW
jgi:hypothetical protein